MALKTANQYIEFSEKIGGARVVFEGHPWALPGGFNFNIADLPDYPNVLPAGTPIYCDDTLRTIAIHYAFKVVEAISATKTFKVEKNNQGSRIKAGMIIMVAPATAETTGQSYKVSSVDTSNPDYDSVTLTANATFAQGAILVEATGTAVAENATMKVVPNALLDRDVVKDTKAKLVNATGIWCNDRPVLENRIPPIADAVKAALLANGCYLRFSSRR